MQKQTTDTIVFYLHYRNNHRVGANVFIYPYEHATIVFIQFIFDKQICNSLIWHVPANKGTLCCMFEYSSSNAISIKLKLN